MMKIYPPPDFINYSSQSIDDVDIKSVIEVLKSSHLTQGRKIDEFESALCKYTGAKFCVVVSNGTAALHLAVAVLGLSSKSSGVTSPITFLASANALVYSGIKPIFADIDPRTLNISVDALSRTIQKDTRVVIPVHFTGRPAAMKEIVDIAARRKCFVIEDAAHAIGSRYPGGGRVGNCAYSDMTIFSFHPVKTITTGEGGAITTNNEKIYRMLRSLRSHGTTKEAGRLKQNPGKWYYEMQDLGYNYRLTEIQAALGISQLRKLDQFVARRRRIFKAYSKAFRHLSWLKVPDDSDIDRTAFHLYVVQIDYKFLNITRNEVMNRLESRGVGTQVHYIPVYLQPYYRNHFGYRKGLCPNAESYYEQALSLPLYPMMSDKDIRTVIRAVCDLEKR